MAGGPLPRRTLLAAGVFAAAAAATGTALALRLSGEENIVRPATTSYTEGVAGTWQRVNPIFATTNEVDQDLVRLVFAGLVRLGPAGELLPGLAGLPEVSPDGRTYTFRLERDLRWHDGATLTSADVAFTIARIKEAGFRGDPALAEAWLGVEVDVPDDNTVIFRLSQPSASFLARSATIGILPEHLLGSLSAAQLHDAPFNAAPVGAGPYRVHALESREATLTAFAGYHLGRPAIDTIRLRFFTDYPGAIRALAVGSIEGLLIRDSLPPAELAEVEKVKGLRVDRFHRAAYVLLYLNNDQAAYFQDERVRRALSIAIDRRALVDRVFTGQARASASAVAPGTWAYADQYDTVVPALDDARRLLAEAGWKPHPTSGILIREGSEFRFTIRTDNDAVRMAIAAEIARQLEPLGIRATVASTTVAVLRRDFLQERKYDAAVYGWDQGPDPDPYFGWHSSQMGTAGLNIANYADVVADSLIAQGRTATDFEVRRDAYRQFQEVWQTTAPSVVIAYPLYLYAHTTALEGPAEAVLFEASLRFSEVHRWKR